MKVNMTPNPLDVVTIHASQGDTEARQWEFELHNNGELIDTSDVKEQMVFKAYKGGTEQLLPENGSVPTTSPIIADIKYPHGELTDQEFLYRQSPTEEDGLAKITDIKGNTIVWNQIIQNGNFADTSGWGIYQPANASISVNSNVLTETLTISTMTQGNAYTIGLQKTNVISDATHKYLCFVTITLSFTSNVRIELGGSAVLGTNPINANTKTTLSVVSTAYTYNKNLLIYPQSGVVGIDLSGQTLKYENIMLIDLTLMFGAGNEPTTVDAFTSLFPLPYYDYNAGSLLSFNGNGIKTVGKNLMPNKTYKTGNNVYIGSDSDNYDIWLNEGTYTITRNVNENCGLFYKDINRSENISIMPSSTEAGVKSRTFTITESSYYRFWFYKGGGGVDLENVVYFQLEFGSTATSYEPYTSSTLSLPISTYFPTGMKSAGTVYDELTPTKAITRIGVVDLGTLNWSYVSADRRFIAIISDAKSSSGLTVLENIVSAKYENATWENILTQAKDKIIALHYTSNNNYVAVIDNDYSDATTFKTAMNGVMLYYELATPTETSFTTASLVTENAEIPLSNEDGTLIGKCTEELSAEPGFHDAKIKLTDSDGTCYSNKLQLHVERKPS